MINQQINSECLTLCLSRRLAMADGRNQQAAMIATARKIRGETRSKDTYESLGMLITATPEERLSIVELSEKMFMELG